MSNDDERQARLAAIRARLEAVVQTWSSGSGPTQSDDIAWLLSELEAATARAEHAEAGLRWSERNTLTELVGHGSNLLWMCSICDQVGEKASVPHAPDCPFAALAERGE